MSDVMGVVRLPSQQRRPLKLPPNKPLKLTAACFCAAASRARDQSW
jgi:hypothetical protein